MKNRVLFRRQSVRSDPMQIHRRDRYLPVRVGERNHKRLNSEFRARDEQGREHREQTHEQEQVHAAGHP